MSVWEKFIVLKIITFKLMDLMVMGLKYYMLASTNPTEIFLVILF